MKKYNRKFDSGFTLTGAGVACKKNSPVLVACGDVDELSCFLGAVKCSVKSRELKGVIERVQNDLILVMGDIASERRGLTKKHVKGLEELILKYEKKVKPAKGWAIPGSSREEARLNVARAVCRRAERAVVSARAAGKISLEVPSYLNRLSDLLFVLGTLVSKGGSR